MKSGDPWNFNEAVVVVKEHESVLPIKEVPLVWIPICVWISGISPAFLTPSTTYLNVESLGQVLNLDPIVFREALGRVQVETMLDRPARLDRSNAFDLVQLVGRCGEPYQSRLSIGSESEAPEYSWMRPTMSVSGPLVLVSVLLIWFFRANVPLSLSTSMFSKIKMKDLFRSDKQPSVTIRPSLCRPRENWRRRG